jgi:hypothetical protein
VRGSAQYSLIIVGMNVAQDGQYGTDRGRRQDLQRREGIAVDGTAGSVTIAALDHAANRRSQIEALRAVSAPRGDH